MLSLVSPPSKSLNLGGVLGTLVQEFSLITDVMPRQILFPLAGILVSCL